MRLGILCEFVVVSSAAPSPDHLQLHEGNHYQLVWHKRNHPERLHEAASKRGMTLDMVIHPDGSVSPARAPDLRLGIAFDPRAFAGTPVA